MYENNQQFNQANKMCCELMLAIQEIEFICCDLRLYCDTHPEDSCALDKYNMYSKKLRELKTCYDRECEPLQNFGYSTSDKSWVYSKPWPWE